MAFAWTRGRWKPSHPGPFLPPSRSYNGSSDSPISTAGSLLTTSTITSPLTDLLKGKAKSLSWNPFATEAINTLKKAFTSAPLLVHPNPGLPFVVEVDASTTGVGAVLSQQQGTPPKLHPCAFFSRKLSPAERNYDIGNRELLAIKLALEEWRHWLEESAQPFLVLTDHKNLQYLRDAKRLNPRQARWALFFTRFQFKISYRPGPRNIKADALSRIHTLEECKEEPEGIIPTEMISRLLQSSCQPAGLSTRPSIRPKDSAHAPHPLHSHFNSIQFKKLYLSPRGNSKAY